jgi:thioredoxin reductase (NADPH)
MTYDVIIIGGGPAGLAAAISTSKHNLKTLLIEKYICGGKLLDIQFLNDYPGFYRGIHGEKLAMYFDKHARSFGTQVIYDEVIRINNSNKHIKTLTTKKSLYQGKIIIIATGMSTKKLNIVGEKQFQGKGVSFCALCDAKFYQDKKVILVGNSKVAIKEAIYLSQFAHDIIIINKNNKLNIEEELLDYLLSLKNIHMLNNSMLQSIHGRDYVEQVGIYDLYTKKTKLLDVNGVFISIGNQPNTYFVPSLILDPKLHILTNNSMSTSIKGIFACGDVRSNNLKQVIIATSEGTQAAISSRLFLKNIL